VFCDIVAGIVPAFIVHEDTDSRAFLDRAAYGWLRVGRAARPPGDAGCVRIWAPTPHRWTVVDGASS